MLSPDKAKKILHDKSVQGHALSTKQRGFFGVIASGKTPRKQALKHALSQKKD